MTASVAVLVVGGLTITSFLSPNDDDDSLGIEVDELVKQWEKRLSIDPN